MSVQSQIERLNAVKERIRTNLIAQGIAVPEDSMLEEMANKILSVAGEDGKDGGFYTPSVDAAGVLTWNPNSPDMPEVDAANIRGPQGIPGKSPTVEISDLSYGVQIKATNADGTVSSKVVRHGNNGLDGQPGADGVSPTVSVSKSGKVTTIAITDKNGTKTATVNDGADGAPGSAGKDGASVTVKSVSESTADGGSNVVTFSDGKTLTVKNGSKGSDGGSGDGPSPLVGKLSEITPQQVYDAIKIGRPVSLQGNNIRDYYTNFYRSALEENDCVMSSTIVTGTDGDMLVHKIRGDLGSGEWSSDTTGILTDDQDWLKGTTGEVKPSQVAQAIMLDDRQVMISHNDPTLGLLVFTSFSAFSTASKIVSSCLIVEGDVVACQLTGDLDTDTWTYTTTTLAKAEDASGGGASVLYGSTDEITPVDVVTALLENKQSVVITHILESFGYLVFSSFSLSEAIGSVIASAVVEMDGAMTVFQLAGDIATNEWTCTDSNLSSGGGSTTLIAYEMDGQLSPAQSVTIEELLSSITSELDLFGFKYGVANATTGRISGYSFAFIDGMEDPTNTVMYFTNSTDKMLKMAADGSLSYVQSENKAPVKGEDYWTAEDQASMVQQVIAALPDASEVSY